MQWQGLMPSPGAQQDLRLPQAGSLLLAVAGHQAGTQQQVKQRPQGLRRTRRSPRTRGLRLQTPRGALLLRPGGALGQLLPPTMPQGCCKQSYLPPSSSQQEHHSRLPPKRPETAAAAVPTPPVGCPAGPLIRGCSGSDPGALPRRRGAPLVRPPPSCSSCLCGQRTGTSWVDEGGQQPLLRSRLSLTVLVAPCWTLSSRARQPRQAAELLCLERPQKRWRSMCPRLCRGWHSLSHQCRLVSAMSSEAASSLSRLLHCSKRFLQKNKGGRLHCLSRTPADDLLRRSSKRRQASLCNADWHATEGSGGY